MTHELTIHTDDNSEMIRIERNGVLMFEGNYWDINNDIWISLFRKCDVNIKEKEYNYE